MRFWEWKREALRLREELKTCALKLAARDTDVGNISARLFRIEEVLARHVDDLTPVTRMELALARKPKRNVGEIQDLVAFMRMSAPISVCEHPDNKREYYGGRDVYCAVCKKVIQ